MHAPASPLACCRPPSRAPRCVGMLLLGVLADRIGRRPTFPLCSLLMAAGLLALACFGPQMLEQRAWFWLAMSAVGFGSGCTAGFGALLAELFPTSVRNT